MRDWSENRRRNRCSNPTSATVSVQEFMPCDEKALAKRSLLSLRPEELGPGSSTRTLVETLVRSTRRCTERRSPHHLIAVGCRGRENDDLRQARSMLARKYEALLVAPTCNARRIEQLKIIGEQLACTFTPNRPQSPVKVFQKRRRPSQTGNGNRVVILDTAGDSP